MNSEISIEPIVDANAQIETTTQTEIASRPDHIPEKFWDAETGQPRVEELAKSYRELEKQFGSRDPATKPSDLKIEKAEAGEGETETSDVLPLTTAAESFAAKYEADPASLEDSDFESLVSLGLPRAMIDTYLAGLQALQNHAMTDLYSTAGGQENLEAALAWAGENMSEADIESFNARITDPATQKMSIEWLMSKYNATAPVQANEGKLLSGSGNSHGDVYETRAQFNSDMSDPKYQSDPAFREKVAAKLAASMRAGTIS
ncbi:hypothetical protein WEU32_06915 [Brevundimonas sp. BH3]|uniref:capsid assembly protein n=1 Tax=Brevundimonas sp. BH3 TaxID=3133089 RepID=UPI0032540828